MQTRQTQNSFSGPKSYRNFPETGPSSGGGEIRETKKTKKMAHRFPKAEGFIVPTLAAIPL